MPRLLLAALLLLGLAASAAATTPNTPPDGGAYQAECALDGLSFTNGLVLVGAFSPNKFHYQCSCPNFGGTFTTVVKPHLMDDGSTAEITFNGQEMNFRTQANAISNDGTVLNSPRTESSSLQFKSGLNTIVIGVGCNNRAKPQPCYYQYTITCDKGGGFVVGDPQFVGLRGQSYQIHGVSGEIYNIVSDGDVQYNSRFVFLDQGECPMVNGRKQKGCWSHPGSYLGELGLKTKAGDRIHLVAGDAKTGFAAVEVNDNQLAIGDTVLLNGDLGSVTFNSSHLAALHIGNWDFDFENSDMFVNQRVRVHDARGLRSHGLLGQTWRDSTYPSAIKYVQGAVDDYVIRENDLFGDNFVFNMFN